MKGKLVLQDGTVFRGQLFGGANATTEGEVVFNTGMTGYQEILTDPSYCRQIVTLTYPLVGNYGTAKQFNQSRKSFVGGLIVGEVCEKPSSSSMQKTLAEFLIAEKISCLYDVDTRALTRKIRSSGTMKGVIVSEYTSQGTIDEMMALPIRKNVVEMVTTPVSYTLDAPDGAPYVVTVDFGIKKNILDALRKLGCKITVVPAKATAEEILALNPDGIFFIERSRRPKGRSKCYPRSQKTHRATANLRNLSGSSDFGSGNGCEHLQIKIRAPRLQSAREKFGDRQSRNHRAKSRLRNRRKIFGRPAGQNHAHFFE